MATRPPVEFGTIWPDLGRIRPDSISSWPKLIRDWHTPAKFGRTGTNSEIWSTPGRVYIYKHTFTKARLLGMSGGQLYFGRRAAWTPCPRKGGQHLAPESASQSSEGKPGATGSALDAPLS